MPPTAEQLVRFLEKRGFPGVEVVLTFPGYSIGIPKPDYHEPILEVLSNIEDPGPFDVWEYAPPSPPPRWQFWHHLPWRINIERRHDG